MGEDWTAEQWAAFFQTPYGQAILNTREQSETRAQDFQNKNYTLQVDRLKAERDRIAISENQQVADEWYKKKSHKLAQDAHNEGIRQFNVSESGYLDNGNPTLNRERYQSDAAQGWARLGTEQRGPENAFQYAMLQGAAGSDPLASAGFGAVAGASPGTGGAQQGQGAYGNALSGQTTPASLQGLSSHLLGTGQQQQGQGGGAGVTGSNFGQMYGIAQQWGADPGKAAGQAYEQLGDYKQKVLGSFTEGAGYDPNEVLGRYRQTRFVNG